MEKCVFTGAATVASGTLTFRLRNATGSMSTNWQGLLYAGFDTAATLVLTSVLQINPARMVQRASHNKMVILASANQALKERTAKQM